jgi:hypothetical protein
LKCAGGTFFAITASKSKTLMASFGLEIRLSSWRGAQTIGSGKRSGRSVAMAAKSVPASKGLAARNCRNLRRLVACWASVSMVVSKNK